MSYIEVVFTPHTGNTLIKDIPYKQDLTVEEAIADSGLVDIYPEVSNLDTGVFGSLVKKDYKLQPNDRLEIYRPLTICPKEKRRLRSQKN